MRTLRLVALGLAAALWFAAVQVIVVQILRVPDSVSSPATAAGIGVAWVLFFYGWVAHYFAAEQGDAVDGNVSFPRRVANLWPWGLGGVGIGLASAVASWILASTMGLPVPDLSEAIPGIARGGVWAWGMALMALAGVTVLRNLRYPGWITLGIGLSVWFVLYLMAQVLPVNPLYYLLTLVVPGGTVSAMLWSILYWTIFFGAGFAVGWIVSRRRTA